MSDDRHSQTKGQDAVRLGLLTGIAAYTFWGVFPLYLISLSGVAALEVLAHRIVWSVPFAAILIAMRKQWREVFNAFSDPKVVAMLALSALSISCNWLIYVWAVIQDRILEASIGYYINPLMYVAAGVFILGEKLRRAQIVAIAIAAVGVLIVTIGTGTFPWVAFGLAALFTTYGYIRKTVNVGALPGLFVETTLLTPVAAIYLLIIMSAGAATFQAQSLSMDILLMLAGPLTVIPLVLFALSARRLTMTTIGFLQYIGPTLQFIIALSQGESFTLFHGVCFALIWISLTIFSIDAIRAYAPSSAKNGSRTRARK